MVKQKEFQDAIIEEDIIENPTVGIENINIPAIKIKKRKLNKELFLMTLPALTIIGIFFYIPFYGYILPFKNLRYDLGLWKSPWVGFENFEFLFNSDALWRITRNTIGLNALFIFCTLVFSLLIALLLNELSKRSVKLFQTTFFIPYFISWVVGSYVLFAFLDMEFGFLNRVIGYFGFEPRLWYNEPKIWPLILTIANTWKDMGYYAIIYYTGIIAIDNSLYEAARIDGATKIQEIFHITLPSITPLISLIVILQTGKIFYGKFDMFYNLTRDSSLLYPTTDVIDTFVYRALTQTGDIGMASAVGVYQSIIGLIIVISANKIVKKMSPESAII